MRIRGDNELNFTMAEAAAWERPRGLRHGRESVAANLGLGEGAAWSIIGSVVLFILFILLAGTRDTQPGGITATVRAEVPTALNPVPPASNVYVYDAGGYRAEIFFDSSPTVRVRGTLPPDVTLTRFVAEVPLYYQPYDIGVITATAPANTIFIHSNRIFRAPCWRWVQSLDRIYSGYVCFSSKAGSPAPNSSTADPLNASADAATHENQSSAQHLDAQYFARIKEALDLVDSEKSSPLFEEMNLPEEEAEALRVFEALARQLDKSQQEFLEQLRD